MKKLLLVFVLTFIGCSGDNDSENNNSNNPVFENVLTIDGTEYPLESGSLLNYGGQSGLFNLDLDLWSTGIQVSDCQSDCSGQGQDIYFEMWTSNPNYLDSGSYTVVNDDTNEDYSIGDISYSDFVIDLDCSTIENQEPNWLEISSGNVDVQRSGNTYTISWDLTGYQGEDITGTYSGTLLYCDVSN